MVLVARRTQPSPAEPSRAQPKRASPAAAAAAAPRPRRPPPSGSIALLPGKPPDHARRPTRFCDPPAPRSSERLQSSRRYARHAGERGGTQRPHPEGVGPALPSASSVPFASSPSWSGPLVWLQSPRAPFHRALHPSTVPTPSYPPGAAISVSAAASIPPLAHPAASGILLSQVPFPLWVLPPNPLADLFLVFPARAAFQPCGGSAGLWDWRVWGLC